MSTQQSSAVSDSLMIFPQANAHAADQAHVVQFYADDTFLLDELSKFIGTALVSGSVALIIATSSHRDGVAKRLLGRGLDISRAMQWGRYLPLDAAETLDKFMIDGLPDRAKFLTYFTEVIDRAKVAGEGEPPSVVAFGEMVSLLWAEGNFEGAILLEELWNELAQTRAFHLRCAYPITHFNQEEHAPAFLKICGEHSQVIPGESYTALANDEDRCRIISLLQQKAEALETEIAERKRVQEALLVSQEALRKSHEELETRVVSRTHDLAHAEARLRELSRRLLNLRDEERRRLARELHDSTGQTLAALQLILAMVQAADLDPKVLEKINEAEHLTAQALQEIRTLSYLLHPPMLDEAGLVLALEWYIDGVAQRSGMKVDVDLPAKYERLPQEMELAIFRIVQESLTNVHRHSGSSSASVKLLVDADQVHLCIADSGKGISRENLEAGTGQMGVGIRGMRERVLHLHGQLEILADEGGTMVKVTLPLRKKRHAVELEH
jgi:signal transduction histidine kinase